MNQNTIYNQLCEVANQLNIKVVKGKGNFKGGSCLLKKESMIVINYNYPFESRIQALATCLLEFNLNKIRINKEIRKLLNNVKEQITDE